jgi:DNA uptake protein ComE-like DNA-binding protein
MRKRSGRAHARSAFVMLTVVIIVMASLLVVTGVLFLTRAEAASTAATIEAAQHRAVAWSGVQAVMSKLAAQRAAMLRGQMPEVDAEMKIYDAGQEEGVATLMPIDGEGRLVVAESSRIDLNAANAERLSATGQFSAEEAASIIAGRREGYQSAADLLALEWVTNERFHGPLASFSWRETASSDASESTEKQAPLAELVTVFSAEPEVNERGDRRINVNAPWSDDLRSRLARASSDAIAAAIGSRRESGGAIGSASELFTVVRGLGVEQEELAKLLDAVRYADAAATGGRVNINVASEPVLRSVPGVSEEAAAAIVQMRESVPDDELRSVAWLLAREVLTPDQFRDALPHVTSRSWTFRIRVGAAIRSADSSDEAPVRAVFEAVIDCVDETPRIAVLRDITHLPTLAILAQQAQDSDGADAPAATEEPSTEERAVAGAPADGADPDAEEPPIAAPKRLGRWRAP